MSVKRAKRAVGKAAWVVNDVLDAACDALGERYPSFVNSTAERLATRVFIRIHYFGIACGYDGRCGAHERGDA